MDVRGVGYGKKITPNTEQCLLNAHDGIMTKLSMSFTMYILQGNMSQSELMTRSETSEELLKRGYVKGDYPGIWKAPNGDLLAWFIAVGRERLVFDRKSWGSEISACKKRWKDRKK